MPIVDMKARNEKEIAKITKAVHSFVKKASCNTGQIKIEPANHGVQFIQVDNDGMLAADLASIVKKSDFGKVTRSKDYPGVYDWSSDTYTRPCSCVWFTLS